MNLDKFVDIAEILYTSFNYHLYRENEEDDVFEFQYTFVNYKEQTIPLIIILEIEYIDEHPEVYLKIQDEAKGKNNEIKFQYKGWDHLKQQIIENFYLSGKERIRYEIKKIESHNRDLKKQLQANQDTIHQLECDLENYSKEKNGGNKDGNAN